MTLLSARWVVPIERPPIGEGAIALADDGAVLAVGTRAELRAEFPDAVEERAEGVVLPGLVNAHCHLEHSLHVDGVPGGKGLFAWATALMRARADAPPDHVHAAATGAAGGALALGSAAIADVGNSLTAVPGIGRARLTGVLFHELLGSREAATGDALADAARERAEVVDWPERLGYVPAPHAPYSAGPELLARIFGAAAAAGRATSIHVAEDEDELALLRDGSGRWPAFLAGIGVDPATRVPHKSPVAYLASLGAFQRPETPPLLVHMVHADANDRRIAREAGATVVLCPRSNLHIGGRLPDVDTLVADGLPLAIGTDSLASVPDLSLWAEMATLAAHFPAVPATRWLDAATRAGAQALGLRGFGTLTPGARPGVLDVLVEEMSAPLESLVRDPTPTLRWVARP